MDAKTKTKIATQWFQQERFQLIASSEALVHFLKREHEHGICLKQSKYSVISVVVAVMFKYSSSIPYQL